MRFPRFGAPILPAILATLLAWAVSTPAFSQSPAEESLSRMERAQRQEFNLIELPVRLLPASSFRAELIDSVIPPFDADSIEMFEYKGVATYHPVYMAQRCKEFLGAFEKRGDSTYVRRTEKYMAKLLSLSERYGDALYFPYMFNYANHGDSANLLVAPWYSGMAQGEVLEILSRLFEITRDSSYIESARSVFNSLLQLRGDFQPWVARIDSAGYYWIEEYPHPTRPTMTLNGFIFAVFGVYNYYRVSGDPRAKLVYDLSLTTIVHYLPEYRCKGKSSYYCLRHRSPAGDTYHQLHIGLMDYLYQMTGDEVFATTAREFTEDAEQYRRHHYSYLWYLLLVPGLIGLYFLIRKKKAGSARQS